MGVPKFYRFISDRYPCINKTVKEYEIPEYENLYLDMNSIIHTCSHPSDSDVHFRIGKKEFSDEDIYQNVCRYVDIIFSIVKPVDLMYLAFDGVAPRAKMNQQRGHRFRAAKDINETAIKSEMVQDEILFDTNCITTGTVFMAELMDYIKNFIAYKISTDPVWQKCKIIVSGPEVPGEGEHKIMEYIRYNKAQSNYNPNTRHCLYCLDADLIVLGLCTHEPHFSLIREKITFGKKMNMITPEESDFDLLHLSLLREYLEYEFTPIKSKLKFPFDLEKIIDDWVLIGFLVGNDFIPQLPNLNIVDGALPLLYRIYMKALPTLDGYINESGKLNVQRFKIYLNMLSEFQTNSSKPCELPEYLATKSGSEENNAKNDFKVEILDDDTLKNPLVDEDLESRKKLIEDAFEALDLKCNKAKVESLREDEQTPSIMKGNFDKTEENILLESSILNLSKEDYYKNKLKFQEVDGVMILTIVEQYIKAIQWTLTYYYQGCCSWSWYYPYHYAPLIADFERLQNETFDDFTMGTPFLPLQHLLAVLPPANVHLLPKPLRFLLTNQNSPIIDFYPEQFEVDLNGKTNDWESIVLIPFIDESRLIKAMEPYIKNLNFKERKRNAEGSTAIFTYTKTNLGQYPMETIFGSFENHAQLEHVKLKDMHLPKDKLIPGLCRNVSFNLSFPGFPTLKHVSHTFTFAQNESKFNTHHPTKIERMILRVSPKSANRLEVLAKEFLGQKAYALWPYLREVFVIGVTDFKERIILNNFWNGYSENNVKIEELPSNAIKNLHDDTKLTTDKYKDLLGIEIGETNILFYIFPIIGKKYTCVNNGNIQLKMKYSPLSRTFPYQLLVKDEKVQRYISILYKSINDLFIDSSTCFNISQPNYGAKGEIKSIIARQEQLISVVLEISPEPDFSSSIEELFITNNTYMTSSGVAKKLKISSTLISRITGSLVVTEDHNKLKYHDIGLRMKFPKHEKELFGYTKKDNKGWTYSEKALQLIQCYSNEFPYIFENLNKNVNSTTFAVSDIFPDGLAQLNLVKAWLSEQKVHYTTFLECHTKTLGLNGVPTLEKHLTDFFSEEKNKKMVSTQVKAQSLFVPGTLMGLVPPDFQAEHRLLDRIICIRNNFTVPLGLKGTVIGIQERPEKCKNVYEILFDSSFTGGLTLYESSEHKCYRLMGTDFINISFGQRNLQNSKQSKVNLPFRVPESKVNLPFRVPESKVNLPFRVPKNTDNQPNNTKKFTKNNFKQKNYNDKTSIGTSQIPKNNAQARKNNNGVPKEAFNGSTKEEVSIDGNGNQPIGSKNQNESHKMKTKTNYPKRQLKTITVQSDLPSSVESFERKTGSANEHLNKKSTNYSQNKNTGTRPKVPFNQKNARKFEGQGSQHTQNANPKKNIRPKKNNSEQSQSSNALYNPEVGKKSIDSKDDKNH